MVWNCRLLGALLDLQTKCFWHGMGPSVCRLGGMLRREEIVLFILAAVFPLPTWALSGSKAEAGARRSLCSRRGTNLINTIAWTAEKNWRFSSLSTTLPESLEATQWAVWAGLHPAAVWSIRDSLSILKKELRVQKPRTQRRRWDSRRPPCHPAAWFCACRTSLAKEKSRKTSVHDCRCVLREKPPITWEAWAELGRLPCARQRAEGLGKSRDVQLHRHQVPASTRHRRVLLT